MTEKEYIELEVLLEAVKKASLTQFDWSEKVDLDEFEEVLNNIPTANVVEVVHGEWIEHELAEEENGLLISNFECSACHNWERKRSDYCPNCGAKMDGKGDAE